MLPGNSIEQITLSSHTHLRCGRLKDKIPSRFKLIINCEKKRGLPFVFIWIIFANDFVKRGDRQSKSEICRIRKRNTVKWLKSRLWTASYISLAFWCRIDLLMHSNLITEVFMPNDEIFSCNPKIACPPCNSSSLYNPRKKNFVSLRTKSWFRTWNEAKSAHWRSSSINTSDTFEFIDITSTNIEIK